MIIFKVKENIISIDENATILELKNKIIRELKLKCDYIDINVIIDKPIRKFGKFTLEPGIIPRGYDIYQMNKYDITNKEIIIDIDTIDNYKPYNYKKKINKKMDNENLKYNLDSNDEFPSL